MAVGQSDIPSERPGAPEAGNGDVTMQNGPATSDSQATEDIWDEERIEKALKTLKEVHIQLRGLRTTIPRLIAPLSTKQPSPEALFRSFSNSARTAIQEVQQFRRLMNDPETNNVLEHTRQGRADNPKGIKPWLVTDHPDWLTKEPILEAS